MGTCCAVTRTESVFLEKKEVTEEVEIRRIKSTYQYSKKIANSDFVVREEDKESSSNQKSLSNTNFVKEMIKVVQVKAKPLEIKLSCSEEELKRLSEKNEKLNKERAEKRANQIKLLKEFKSNLEEAKVINDADKLVRISMTMIQDENEKLLNGGDVSERKKEERSVVEPSLGNQDNVSGNLSSPRKKLVAMMSPARRMKRATTANKDDVDNRLEDQQNDEENERRDTYTIGILTPVSPTKGLLKRSRTSTFYQESRRLERMAKKVKFQDLEYIKENKRKR